MLGDFDLKECGHIEGKKAILVSAREGERFQVLDNPKLLGDIARAINAELGLSAENVRFMAPTWDEPVQFIVAVLNE